MSRRFVVAMLGLGLALILMPQVSLAAEDHIAEAITHTKQRHRSWQARTCRCPCYSCRGGAHTRGSW